MYCMKSWAFRKKVRFLFRKRMKVGRSTPIVRFTRSALLVMSKESRSAMRMRWNQVSSTFQLEPERSWAKSMAKPRTWRRW